MLQELLISDSCPVLGKQHFFFKVLPAYLPYFFQRILVDTLLFFFFDVII